MNGFDFFMTACFCMTIILVICTYFSEWKEKKRKKSTFDF